MDRSAASIIGPAKFGIGAAAQTADRVGGLRPEIQARERSKRVRERGARATHRLASPASLHVRKHRDQWGDARSGSGLRPESLRRRRLGRAAEIHALRLWKSCGRGTACVDSRHSSTERAPSPERDCARQEERSAARMIWLVSWKVLRICMAPEPLRLCKPAPYFSSAQKIERPPLTQDGYLVTAPARPSPCHHTYCQAPSTFSAHGQT